MCRSSCQSWNIRKFDDQVKGIAQCAMIMACLFVLCQCGFFELSLLENMVEPVLKLWLNQLYGKLRYLKNMIFMILKFQLNITILLPWLKLISCWAKRWSPLVFVELLLTLLFKEPLNRLLLLVLYFPGGSVIRYVFLSADPVEEVKVGIGILIVTWFCGENFRNCFLSFLR